MGRLVLVGLGGAVGTMARYLLALALRNVSPFPLATLVVNVIGCFLMGAVMELALQGRVGDDARVVLGTGFLGGLTTYSAFNQETTRLFASGSGMVGALNVAATAAGCALAGLAGAQILRR